MARQDSQVCLTFTLRAGAEAEYDRRHRSVLPALLEEIRQAGITRNAVYRVGRSVIVVVTHPEDVMTALARVGASAPAARWNAMFADLMESQPAEASEVWRLDAAPSNRG